MCSKEQLHLPTRKHGSALSKKDAATLCMDHYLLDGTKRLIKPLLLPHNSKRGKSVAQADHTTITALQATLTEADWMSHQLCYACNER